MIYKLKDVVAETAELYRRKEFSSFPSTPSLNKWRDQNGKFEPTSGRFTSRQRVRKADSVVYVKPPFGRLPKLPAVHPLHDIGTTETPEERAAELQARWVQLKLRRQGLFTDAQLARRARAKKRRNASRRALQIADAVDASTEIPT